MSAEFIRLLGIMDDLRAKCPWDQKQTLESLSHLTIEEIYELYDAILDKNDENLKEEIADIMLHLVFYMKILNEKDGTTVDDILRKGNEKLISRHPHIYALEQDLTVEEVKQNWEKLKKKEGRESIFSGVPKSLPSIVKALRIQDKAKHTGFDWTDYEQVRDKLTEEVTEFDEAVESKNIDRIEDEMGDLFFTLVNLSRFLKIDPEMALQRTNQKFIKRFQYIERTASKPLEEMTLDEMESLWVEAKKEP
jgi:XTP/dITP diphosphohydrolase